MTTTPHQPVLPARLEGRSLLVARAAWLVLVVASTTLVAVGFVRAFVDPRLVALPPLTDLFTALGLDFRLMIVVSLLTPFVTVVAVCALVFRRRSDDPMALLFTLALLLLYAFVSRTSLTFVDTPVLRHVVSGFFAAAMACLILVLSLFPDGRWTPRWSRWLPLASAVLVIAFPDSGRQLMAFIEGGVPVTGRSRMLVGGWAAVFTLGLLAQVRRYRHVSGAVERKQTKWVVFALGTMMVLFVVVLTTPLLRPGPPDAWEGTLLFLTMPFGILLPLMVANAVLRYHLFEIDRAISRTVAYTLLTAVLVGLYAASVTGLGAVARAVTGGGGGDLVVAASTLAAAALFQPLRRRVQALVDRRFNRAGYDVQLTVEGFAQHLRAEVDLDELGRQVRAVVMHALQPASVSLWLQDAATPDRGTAPDPASRHDTS
jgi:hypothetical protein